MHNKSSQELIPRETFKAILVDIKNYKQDKKIDNTLDSAYILNKTLAKHGISDSLYQQTILFYAEEPEELVDLLKELEDSLGK